MASFSAHFRMMHVHQYQCTSLSTDRMRYPTYIECSLEYCNPTGYPEPDRNVNGCRVKSPGVGSGASYDLKSGPEPVISDISTFQSIFAISN
jgi:hypothetical protein